MFVEEGIPENKGLPESKHMILRSVRRDLDGNKRIEKGLITQNNNTELKDEREN